MEGGGGGGGEVVGKALLLRNDNVRFEFRGVQPRDVFSNRFNCKETAT